MKKILLLILCGLIFMVYLACPSNPSSKEEEGASPYVVTGDKIYSKSVNYYCYVNQEISFNSTAGSSEYSGLTINIDRYASGHGNSVNISGYDRVHFTLNTSKTGNWRLVICNDSEGKIYIVSAFLVGAGENSIELDLSTFYTNGTFNPSQVSNVVILFSGVGPYSFKIKNIYFYNSSSPDTKFRIAGVQSYPWPSDKASITKTVFEDELDYNTASSVWALAVVLNKNDEDYDSTVDLSGYSKLSFDIKADAGNVVVSLYDGSESQYAINGVSSLSYSTYSINLSGFPGIDLKKLKEIWFRPSGSTTGKLFVRNIKFE